jgi:N-acetylneuraminic acid mutarotase
MKIRLILSDFGWRSTSKSRLWQNPRCFMKNKIRYGAAALLFLISLVTLASAFNLPNKSSSLSPRLASLPTTVKSAQHHTTLTFADRVAYQRAIEEVYWRHRIWPKERRDPKPPLDKVMSRAQIEKKVQDYLRDSQTLEDYWQRPITPDQLQAEMERIASHTKQPAVLREIFAALGNDPFVIAECLARPVLAERLLTEVNNEDRVKLTRIAWLKEPLRSWLAKAEAQLPMTMAALAANYTLPVVSNPSSICTDDTWTPTSITNAPSSRDFHTAVWTGSEMIVWGGFDGNELNTGGRYSPSTDSWTATSTTNTPTAREYHTAVWTGSEMIVWGGLEAFGGYLNTGGRYDPSTDSWTATSTTNAPAARWTHTAVWSGSEMIVWGGYDGSNNVNTGGRYNPSTDGWTVTTTTNAPTARSYHTAIWTGSEMIIWGGANNLATYFNTGGRYNPSTDTWTATSTTNAPSARDSHTAVWTGTGNEMIVWGGGNNGSDFNTGGRYNPGSDTWTATSTTNAPAARDGHTAVWTGSEMVVWGGFVPPRSYLNTGGRYNPSTDSWTATSTTSVPAGREYHTAVWSGSEMIVWGGNGISLFNTGGRYCAGNPVPVLTSLLPSSKTVGSPGFTLTVNGSNFVSGSKVHWNSLVLTTTFVSSTQLTAAVPSSDIRTAGTASVTVVNAPPGGGTSNAITFTVNNPVPAISSISPSSATAGGPSFTLTVNGSHFVSGSVVDWNGSARTTTFASRTRLTASISAADIATPGTASVTVVNAPPGGGMSNAKTFTINP